MFKFPASLIPVTSIFEAKSEECIESTCGSGRQTCVRQQRNARPQMEKAVCVTCVAAPDAQLSDER